MKSLHHVGAGPPFVPCRSDRVAIERLGHKSLLAAENVDTEIMAAAI